MSHDPFVYTAVQYENALAQCAALVARVVAAETALAATRAENEQLQAIADDFRAFLASLNEDADVPDQPNPDGPVWAVCGYCGGNIFRHYDWSHEQGTPPQGHDATPLLDVPDQPNPTDRPDSYIADGWHWAPGIPHPVGRCPDCVPDQPNPGEAD